MVCIPVFSLAFISEVSHGSRRRTLATTHAAFCKTRSHMPNLSLAVDGNRFGRVHVHMQVAFPTKMIKLRSTRGRLQIRGVILVPSCQGLRTPIKHSSRPYPIVENGVHGSLSIAFIDGVYQGASLRSHRKLLSDRFLDSSERTTSYRNCGWTSNYHSFSLTESGPHVPLEPARLVGFSV